MSEPGTNTTTKSNNTTTISEELRTSIANIIHDVKDELMQHVQECVAVEMEGTARECENNVDSTDSSDNINLPMI